MVTEQPKNKNKNLNHKNSQVKAPNFILIIGYGPHYR